MRCLELIRRVNLLSEVTDGGHLFVQIIIVVTPNKPRMPPGIPCTSITTCSLVLLHVDDIECIQEFNFEQLGPLGTVEQGILACTEH